MLSTTRSITEELENLNLRIKLKSKNNKKLIKKLNKSSEMSVINNADFVIKSIEENIQNHQNNSFFGDKETLIANSCYEKSVKFLKYYSTEKRKHNYVSPQSVQQSNDILSSNFSDSLNSSNSILPPHEPVFKQKIKATRKSKEKRMCSSRFALDSNPSCHQLKIKKTKNKVFHKEQPNEVEIMAVSNRNKGLILNIESNISKNKSSVNKLTTLNIGPFNYQKENECIDLCHIQDDQDCLILPNSLPEKITKLKHDSGMQQCNFANMSIEHKENQQAIDSFIPVIDISDPEVIFVKSHKTKIQSCYDNSCDFRKLKTKKSQKEKFNTKESNIHRELMENNKESSEKYDKNSDLNSVHVDSVNSYKMNNTSVITKKNNFIEENFINHTTDSKIICMDMPLEESYVNESFESFNCVLPKWNFQKEPVDFPVPRLHHSFKISKQVLEQLKSEGTKINDSRWTKREEDLLRRNYNNFTSQFGINNVFLLLGIGRQFSPHKCENKNIKMFLKAKNFYLRLGKDINDRTLFSIYRKARVLLNPQRSNVSSNAKDLPLIQQLHKKYGVKWHLIGYKLGKCPIYCQNIFDLLNNSSQTGKWSDSEIERLINGIKYVTKSKDLNFKHLRRAISWQKVSDFVSTRSMSQCRKQWLTLTKKKCV